MRNFRDLATELREARSVWDAPIVRGCWRLAFACLLIGCQQPTPSATARSDASAPVSPEHPQHLPVVDASANADAGAAGDAAAVDASAPDGAPLRPAAAPHRSLHIDRVAALDARRVLAVGNGQLFRLGDDHWIREPIEGAEPRDVVASHGALWVLAKGTGGNLGRALVIRTRTGEDLFAIATPDLGSGSDPRVIWVAREGDYFIGGAHPPLVRVQGTQLITLPAGDAPVTSLVRLHDDVVVAGHVDGSVTVGRWGEMRTITVPDYLATIVDSYGTGYLVHEHGEISHGRPGREIQAIAPAPPFAPRIAGALLHEQLGEVGAHGPIAIWSGGSWNVVNGDLPADPIAILATDPPMVVGADGQVSAVRAGRVEVIVGPGGVAPSAH